MPKSLVFTLFVGLFFLVDLSQGGSEAWICQTLNPCRFLHTWVRIKSHDSKHRKACENLPYGWANVGFEKKGDHLKSYQYQSPNCKKKSGVIRNDGKAGKKSWCQTWKTLDISTPQSCQLLQTLVQDEGWGCADYNIYYGVVPFLTKIGLPFTAADPTTVCNLYPSYVFHEGVAPPKSGAVCYMFTCTFYKAYLQSYASLLLSAEEPIVPEGWTCNQTWYNSSDGCHCNCGEWDPDCDAYNAKTFNCDQDEVCLPPGECASRPEVVTA